MWLMRLVFENQRLARFPEVIKGSWYWLKLTVGFMILEGNDCWDFRARMGDVMEHKSRQLKKRKHYRCRYISRHSSYTIYTLWSWKLTFTSFNLLENAVSLHLRVWKSKLTVHCDGRPYRKNNFFSHTLGVCDPGNAVVTPSYTSQHGYRNTINLAPISLFPSLVLNVAPRFILWELILPEFSSILTDASSLEKKSEHIA